MYKTHQMATTIKQLKQQLLDHQEVEGELAKRSHFCQKVIQRYKDQIKDFKEKIVKAKELRAGPNQKQMDEQQLIEYFNNKISNTQHRLIETQERLREQ